MDGDRAGGPLTPSLADAPLILDTDIGGYLDDALALAIAARQTPQLALVVTCDEQDGQRARFARLLLDLLDRADVPVVAGVALEEAGRWFWIAGMIPETVPAQPSNLCAALTRLLSRTDRLRWLGCGPMSNLAAVLTARPEWADRFWVVQQGGSFRDGHRGPATRNLGRDPVAAREALATVDRPTLVTSKLATTRGPASIDRASTIYRRLREPGAPDWARLLGAHFDRCVAQTRSAGIMADVLALSTALGLPFVELDRDRISVDRAGGIALDPTGREVFYTRGHDYPALLRWLTHHLDPAWPPVAPTAAHTRPATERRDASA